MTGEVEKMIEKWRDQLPGWQKWCFDLLSQLGFHDLGYRLFGFEQWHQRQG